MIIEVLTLCLLVLLVVAVIGLFAMMGELNAKVAASASAADTETIWPAARSRPGPLKGWPQELDQVVRAGGAVVALSTSCATCDKVLSEDPKYFTDGLPKAVVVVSGDLVSAHEFIDEYPVLARMPVYVDPGGEWLREAVGLDSSPAVFTVRDGTVLEVFNFNSASALAGLAVASTEEMRQA